MRDVKRRMALVTLIAFFVSCSGKFHAPVMTQYVYQIYTNEVYGNISLGHQVSKQPCMNSSALNSTRDPLMEEVGM